MVAARAEATPFAEMLVDEHGRALDFRAFRDAAERTAGWLAARGVGAGTPVTWRLPTTVEALVLTAALARVGAVQNPVMPVLGARELRFALVQTGARLLVSAATAEPGRDLAGEAWEAAEGLPGLDTVILDGGLPEAEPLTGPSPLEDDPVRWVFYTSGTTADPKGARHTDSSVLASSRAMGERIACAPEDRVGMVFPVAHIGGCGTWLGACLLFGCTLILDAAFDVARSTELQRREGVTLAGSGTVFIQAYLAEARREQGAGRLFPQVRAMTAGAAPKPPTLHAEVRKVLGGVGVLSGYGLTEAPILAMGGPADPDDALARTEGRATRGVDLRVVNAEGRVLGPGEEGELRAKGPQVMRGYTDPALDAAAFDADGYLRTGDLARIDADGHVTITGRLKDIVIRKGENISALAVEQAVAAHPEVAEVAVVALPDPARGELACAVVVPVPGGPVPDLTALTAFLADAEVPVRLWPERVEAVAALPRNATGKILKAELTARYAAAPAES
ncbi:class I adenylate-forming enzyme family protein [Actinocorallia herbida]|uniref:class I adenylate-forming enzyme family protein n=1 Tax=Actinocorallia herbida TaxID=58109 RepID=UPI001B8815FB|nr:AMP-binding protein [Actinocorallia herbida]